MRVFISWSGEPSRRVADLLRKYLPCMIQDLVPFMSQHDLSSGGRWSEQLSKELDAANFGIICLTPNNLENPWILFEAGALTKHVEGRACCLLLRGLGPADVSGPLSQFQNRVFSRDGFQKLLFDLNDLLEKRIERASLQMIFDKWWTDLDREVTAALADPALEAPIEHKRDQSDLLEELLLRVRNVQRALEARPVVEPARSHPSPATLQSSLAFFLKVLTRGQRSLLRLLVTPTGTLRRVDVSEILATHTKEDLDILINSGVVAEADEGVVVVHNLVAPYLAAMLYQPNL